MFKKIQRKLALICSLATTVIVALILLFCLLVSEQNMKKEEENLFIMKANSLSFDLATTSNIDAAWYSKIEDNGRDLLYIEVNGSPSALSSLLLTDGQNELIRCLKEYRTTAKLKEIENPSTRYLYNLHTEQKSFEYNHEGVPYMVMDSRIAKNRSVIDFLFVHSMADFDQKISAQRIRYLLVFLVSVLALYVFSYFFTAHAMKPLMENHAKQKQFVSLASHELRSPLAVFKTGLSLLKNHPEPQRAARIHGMMDEELLRMERLLNDLLFLSKAEQAALPYNFSQVNLAELLESVCEKYQEIAAKRDITLSLKDINLPAPLCHCDRGRIEQVIIILVDNALTYTPAGKAVTLGISASRNRYYLSVSDTGVGISDEEKEKIFDKFYQTDAAHNNKDHFGLGLSIAREICRAHHGSIAVTDTPGGGCTFTVKLPQ